MRIHKDISFIILFSILIGCSSSLTLEDSNLLKEKLEFDIRALNNEGLFGPPDGLVSLDYEFCIPNVDSIKNQVQAIDSFIQFFSNSKGRVNCNKNSIRCKGNTHQKRHKEILLELVRLDYITTIKQVFFEK